MKEMMLHVRNAVRLLVLLFVLAHPTTPSSSTTQHPDQEARPETVGQLDSSKDPKNLFSPRMEYDEWTPLGRGDPLKNDPTYDYVPPVLERVHYWIEPSSRTPDPPMSTHSTKETQASRVRPSPGDNHRNSESSLADSRRDIYDPYFLKFVDGPKFTSTQHRNYQHIYHHHYYRRPPTLSHQSNGPPNQRLHHYMPSYHSSYQHKNQQKQRPYESQILSERNHPKENHKMEVDTSNSSRADHEEKQRPTFDSSMFEADLNNNHNADDQPPRTPYTILVPPPLQIPSSFTSMSNLEKPAPISESNKGVLQPSSSAQNTVTIQQSNLVYQSSTSSTPLWEEGKTQLATTAAPSSRVTWKAPAPTKVGFNTHATSINKYSSKQPYIPPMSVTTMHNMYYNPSLVHSPNVEVIPSTELHFNDSNNIHFSEDTNPGVSKNHHQQSQQWSTSMIVTTMPPSTITMTTSSSLTTDPLFSHYKQPVEPLRGPMYLIIQGHSKVKTYGANKSQNTYHGIPLQENNHISNHELSENKNDRIGEKFQDFDQNEHKRIAESIPKMEKEYLQQSKNEGDLSVIENEILRDDVTTSIPTTIDLV
ncbi:hypothetical protein C0J52_05032 [Blattella germanica]|nr:hypothetical protein C0J52_05032 [Blattella germanica]